MAQVYVYDEHKNRYPAYTAEQVLNIIQQVIDTGSLQGIDPEACPVVRLIRESNKNSDVSFWVGTEAEYNALGITGGSKVIAHIDKNGKIYFSEDDEAYTEFIQRVVDEAREAAQEVAEDKVSKTEKTVTLSASAWASNAQTVSVEGVTADNIVIVSASAGSHDEYGKAGVRCTGQGANSLTFNCSKVPTVNLTVNVLILS